MTRTEPAHDVQHSYKQHVCFLETYILMVEHNTHGSLVSWVWGGATKRATKSCEEHKNVIVDWWLDLHNGP